MAPSKSAQEGQRAMKSEGFLTTSGTRVLTLWIGLLEFSQYSPFVIIYSSLVRPSNQSRKDRAEQLS